MLLNQKKPLYQLSRKISITFDFTLSCKYPNLTYIMQIIGIKRKNKAKQRKSEI